MLIIKRYSNRKLYSTETSKYINLKDILEFTKSGILFQVIDMKTRRDLTMETIVKANVQQTLNQLKGEAIYV